MNFLECLLWFLAGWFFLGLISVIISILEYKFLKSNIYVEDIPDFLLLFVFGLVSFLGICMISIKRYLYDPLKKKYEKNKNKIIFKFKKPKNHSLK